MALGMGNYGRKGLFGKLVSPAPHEAQPMGQQMAAPMQQPQQQPKKPKFLGEGGAGRAIAGVLGDTLLQYNGMAPMYAPTMLQQRESEAKARQAQLQRAQELADWQWKQEWERDNPKPVSNDTVADYEFIKGQLGEEAAKQYLQNRADPPQYRQGADGRFYRIETGQAPTAPVGKLTPIGGPSQSAAGDFRPGQ